MNNHMFRIISRPYIGSTSQSCICSCFNMQYFTTSYGILKIIQIIKDTIIRNQVMGLLNL
ncbi:protein singles bar [Aphis craccivora]|uniref:Protein singles bar n=1 Tax=Aphis craccivora TaxID=307492 RepID=A0A6G0YRS5_APHCR|nr:protein singles bar [Aphis craccivora]